MNSSEKKFQNHYYFAVNKREIIILIMIRNMMKRVVCYGRGIPIDVIESQETFEICNKIQLKFRNQSLESKIVKSFNKKILERKTNAP